MSDNLGEWLLLIAFSWLFNYHYTVLIVVCAAIYACVQHDTTIKSWVIMLLLILWMRLDC